MNHLSDSISIVDVAGTPPRVVRTLLTCDEPRDIVFAGPGGNRAFVTTARRGQNCPLDREPQRPPGIGRARSCRSSTRRTSARTLGGTPLANLVLFGDTPRALARSADGNTVYAAVFHSGNQTTAISEERSATAAQRARRAPWRLGAPGRPAGARTSTSRTSRARGRPHRQVRPRHRRVARRDRPRLDARRRASSCPTSTCSRSTPTRRCRRDRELRARRHGALQHGDEPRDGKVYVSNTEARNEVRFEGPGSRSAHDRAGPPARGAHHRARRRDVLPAAPEQAHRLRAASRARRGVKEKSLATPLGMAVTSDGATLYVAAFGSCKIGVFDTAALENDTFVPSAPTTSPSAAAGRPASSSTRPRGRLYVLTRFDDSISVVNTATAIEMPHIPLHNPEPAAIVDGRPLPLRRARSPRATARRRARAATSSATWTTSPGTSATPTTSC